MPAGRCRLLLNPAAITLGFVEARGTHPTLVRPRGPLSDRTCVVFHATMARGGYPGRAMRRSPPGERKRGLRAKPGGSTPLLATRVAAATTHAVPVLRTGTRAVVARRSRASRRAPARGPRSSRSTVASVRRVRSRRSSTGPVASPGSATSAHRVVRPAAHDRPAIAESSSMSVVRPVRKASRSNATAS